MAIKKTMKDRAESEKKHYCGRERVLKGSKQNRARQAVHHCWPACSRLRKSTQCFESRQGGLFSVYFQSGL